MGRNPGVNYNNEGNNDGSDDGYNDDNQDDNDHSSDDSFWFSKPFKYKSFDLDSMASEESFSNGSNCLVDVDAGTIDSLESEHLADGVSDDAIENIFLQQCQESVSQQTEESADISENEDSNEKQTKTDPKIFVPALNAYKYKSQVISELGRYGELSSDRIVRIHQHREGLSSDNDGVNSKYSVGLFCHIAVKTDNNLGFFLGYVKRMIRSYRTQNGTSRRIDYVRPVDIRDCPREITIKVILLDKKDDNIYTQTDINLDVSVKNVLCKV